MDSHSSPLSGFETADENSSTSFSQYTEPMSGSSIYESAAESAADMTFSFLNDSANKSTDFDDTLNGTPVHSDDTSATTVATTTTTSTPRNGALNKSQQLQADSRDTTASSSLEEVDPKSQLANKTIFKTDNPNLSIIEISANSENERELQQSVVLVETPSLDGDRSEQGSDPEAVKPSGTPNRPVDSKQSKTDEAAAAEKRRRRAETLIHSSKQKLNVAIAEASAAESGGGTQANGQAVVVHEGEQPETKRPIKVYSSIEEFEKNLPSTVTILDTPFGSRVYLVGTAHFSEESQDDVSFVIRNVRPDVVMVELCPSRIHILKLDEKTLLEEAKNFNLTKIRNIIQAHGYINGIFFILLLQMSAQIAKDLGMAPGGEFRRAFEEIHKIPGCMLHLGDRPIRVTLHRALRALSLWQTIKLVWRLTSTDTISIEEVEECKQRDLLEKLMQEMAGEFPAFSDVFVKERDLFLCHSLQMAAMPQMSLDGSSLGRPTRVVGVVGIGHANGIAKMWGRVDPLKIPPIMEIPPASPSTRVFKYTIKYGLIGLTLFGAFKLLRPRLTRFF